MQTVLKLGIMLVLICVLAVGEDSSSHLYDIKSGKVFYKIKGSGKIMGGNIYIEGKKKLIFDDYGVYTLSEEEKIQKQTIMGQKNIIKTHTMIYFKDGIAYIVDFNTKKIFRNPDTSLSFFTNNKSNIKKYGEEMMKNMGGKKVGTDTILGYKCDVWEVMGMKYCIYKGIPLKIESNIMGLKSEEVATKVTFDVSLSKEDFLLPNFSVYDMNGEKLDKSLLSAMDKKTKADEAQANKQMEKMVEILTKAAKTAGVKDGKNPSKKQEKAIENILLNQMKKDYNIEIKALNFAKDCFSSADTLNEAKQCNTKTNQMLGQPTDPEDDLTKWDKQIKKEILKELEQNLKEIDCAKKAKTLQEMNACMPD